MKAGTDIGVCFAEITTQSRKQSCSQEGNFFLLWQLAVHRVRAGFYCQMWVADVR